MSAQIIDGQAIAMEMVSVEAGSRSFKTKGIFRDLR